MRRVVWYILIQCIVYLIVCFILGFWISPMPLLDVMDWPPEGRLILLGAMVMALVFPLPLVFGDIIVPPALPPSLSSEHQCHDKSNTACKP
jgi:hypothetical protein